MGLVAGEHDEVHVAAGLRGRLRTGNERDFRRAGVKLGIGIMPFPDHVLAGAPAPADFFLQPLAEGPNLEVVPRAIQAIKPHAASLLDSDAELRLEAINRLVGASTKYLPGSATWTWIEAEVSLQFSGAPRKAFRERNVLAKVPT